MNLASVVRINAANLGQKPAILFEDETLSYADVWRSIEGLAAALQAAGIAPGERVGLAMKDHPMHLLAHYAVARLGAVILPIDHRWTEREKKAAAAIFDAKLVLTDGEAIDGTPTLALDESVVDTDVSSLPETNEDRDPALLISLSSGTTGTPKGALVTHGNLYERFVSQWTAIGFDSRDCFALVTPLYFGAGRSFGMSMLAAGGTVRIAPPPLTPGEIVNVLKRREVTATFLPPTLLRRLLPLAEGEHTPLFPDVDYLLVSGEPLYASEAEECREKICPNLVGYYASSEGGGISVLTSADFAEHAATVGTPTFRTEVQIVDEDGVELPAGKVGLLRYRGPGVAIRFVDSDGQETHAGADGWFYPGDLAEKLASGHIALRGRDKDVIIRGGVNVYPAEIESVLQQHAAIGECAVIGIEDEARGQLVTACIVTSDDVDDSELEAHCAERLAPYKIPSRFLRIDALPKKNSGKIDKQALAARL